MRQRRKEVSAKFTDDQDAPIGTGALSHWEHLDCNTEHASELSHWGVRRLGYLSTNFFLSLVKALLLSHPQSTLH